MRKAMFVMVITGVLLLAFSGCQSASLVDRSRTISVQGTGKVTVSPDVASFSVTVSELGETTREAQKKANTKVGELMSILRDAGVDEKDISTASLEFRPEYQWIDDQRILVGQRVSQTIHVAVRSIDTESSVLPALIDAMGTVSNITVSSISFSKEDPSSAYARSRELAMEKAIQKAREYAIAAGMTLGKPLTVADRYNTDYQTVSQSTPVRAMGAFMEDFPASEIPTGELKITSTVSVVFEMK